MVNSDSYPARKLVWPPFTLGLSEGKQRALLVDVREKLCVHACYSLQPCLTLCDPMDCGLPGSFVHEILQARTLEWIAMPSSRESFQPRDQTQSLKSPALAHSFFTTSPTWEAPGTSCTLSHLIITKDAVV